MSWKKLLGYMFSYLYLANIKLQNGKFLQQHFKKISQTLCQPSLLNQKHNAGWFILKAL